MDMWDIEPKVGDLLFYSRFNNYYLCLGDELLLDLQTQKVFRHIFFGRPQWEILNEH
jgi:hypothetical protein